MESLLHGRRRGIVAEFGSVRPNFAIAALELLELVLDQTFASCYMFDRHSRVPCCSGPRVMQPGCEDPLSGHTTMSCLVVHVCI